jgi:outer membrane receptor protein involved in Fe transport
MKSIFTIAFLLISFGSFSQLKGVIYGKTVNETRKKIKNAKITSVKTKETAETDEHGLFEITLGKTLPDTLIFSAIGFRNDTLIVSNKDRFSIIEINLYENQILEEFVVQYKKTTHSISKLKTLHVEELGEGELRKAACCNLSESFETNASVDVNMTDAISGAKKIQMMGLDGVYTQIQMENIPYMRGLESAFGLGSMPGTWVESIQITKGTGNVVNGYESMAGLVNLELKKPQSMEKFYFNAYGNRFGRAELNSHGKLNVGKKWQTGLFGHASGLFSEVDNNKDGFRDIPMSKNAAFLNRWNYNGKRMESQLGVNAYYESKEGGQTGFSASRTPNLYGVTIENKHIDFFAKTGFLFEKKPYQSIGILYNLKYQTTHAQFGKRVFHGEEKRGYINAIFDGIIGNTNHGIKGGLSFVFVDLTQKLDSLTLPRVEYVPGAFAEYTFKGLRFTGVLGARGDHHNLYGFQFSPRFHGKFSVTEKLDLRFTAGRGFRVPNVIIDNISLLATSRNWIIEKNIQAEVSWNLGGSIVQEFKFFRRKANISIDFYHTFFENQLIVDRDIDMNNFYFSNLTGKSYSNSFQTEISLPVLPRFDVRLAYKYLDVKAEYGGKMQQQVMIPTQRGFVNLAYKTRNRRWEYDATLSVYGKSRLHMVHDPVAGHSIDNMSKVYPIFNAQITHVFKKWDFYIGGENLTNYKQKNALIDPQNPFGSYFDATRVWAPIQGVNVYVGVRFKLRQAQLSSTGSLRQAHFDRLTSTGSLRQAHFDRLTSTGSLRQAHFDRLSV